ncbi:mechanosensitive ion channel, partial [Candidatus Fermentibacteria bacterium]|nr:mechanosensitive ion channel [Candidatus Fermentibacteria bacterium]
MLSDGLFSWLDGLDIGGFPAGRAALAIAVLAASLGAGRLLTGALRRLGGRLGGFSRPACARTARPAGALVSLEGAYASVRILPLGGTAVAWADRLLLTFTVAGITWLVLEILNAASDNLLESSGGRGSGLDNRVLPLFRTAARILVVAIAVIFLMQSLGYPVGGIIAGLGIGGLAVALAAQDTLAGVFATVAIFLDRPFASGDYIQSGDVQGTVEEIGLRSTRIRTPEKTLVSIPNRILVGQSLDNWSQRDARRTVITLGMLQGSEIERVEALMAALRVSLEASRDVERGTWSVHVSGFGECSLDLEIIAFLKTGDYREWLEKRSRLTLEVLSILRSSGLSLAYPT